MLHFNTSKSHSDSKCYIIWIPIPPQDTMLVAFIQWIIGNVESSREKKANQKLQWKAGETQGRNASKQGYV